MQLDDAKLKRKAQDDYLRKYGALGAAVVSVRIKLFIFGGDSGNHYFSCLADFRFQFIATGAARKSQNRIMNFLTCNDRIVFMDVLMYKQRFTKLFPLGA